MLGNILRLPRTPRENKVSRVRSGQRNRSALLDAQERTPRKVAVI